MALRVIAAPRNRYHQALLFSPGAMAAPERPSTRIARPEDETNLRSRHFGVSVAVIPFLSQLIQDLK
jgi:hypothetical protein